MRKGRLYTVEKYQVLKIPNGLKTYLVKSSQKNSSRTFKEQRLKPVAILQLLFSLCGAIVLVFLALNISKNLYFVVGVCMFVGIVTSCVVAFYVNTYVMVTPNFVESSSIKGQKNRIHYHDITAYSVYDDGYEAGIVLHGNGKELNNGREISAVQVSNVFANLAYLQAQIVFYLMNKRWAEADSENDQNMLMGYIESGRAQEVCMSRGGTIFLNE